VNRIANNFHARSVALVNRLDGGLHKLLLTWAVIASLACGVRIAIAASGAFPVEQFGAALPYILVVGAPIASLLIALYWFRDGNTLPQPEYRLARFGHWRRISASEARKLPLYGVTGFMASLLVGMLINIPVRTLEFLTAIPAIGIHAPTWFSTLFALMLVDVVLLSSLYAIAFVAALRHVPLFPRLLAAISGVDMLMQITIAKVMAGISDLPPAVGSALGDLLEGNFKKVLISVSLWTPYLLLSRRVNLTFRHRVPV
jgi:hypothetical protein